MTLDSNGAFRLDSGDVLKLVFTGAPRTKKNSQQIFKNKQTGKYFVAPSKLYKAYESKCLWDMRRAGVQRKLNFKPISQPVNIQVTYYMPTRARVDLVNLLEATLDILTAGGVLADDNSNIVAGMNGSTVLYDPEKPRAEIIITPASDIFITYKTSRGAELIT